MHSALQQREEMKDCMVALALLWAVNLTTDPPEAESCVRNLEQELRLEKTE